MLAPAFMRLKNKSRRCGGGFPRAPSPFGLLGGALAGGFPPAAREGSYRRTGGICFFALTAAFKIRALKNA